MPRCRRKVYYAEVAEHCAQFHEDWRRCPCGWYVHHTLVQQHLAVAHASWVWGCEERILSRDEVKEHLAAVHLVCVVCRCRFLDQVNFFKHDLLFHRPAC